MAPLAPVSSFPMAPAFFTVVPPLTVYGLFFMPVRHGQPVIPLIKLARARHQTLALRFFLGAAALTTWFWLVYSSFTPHEPWQILQHLQQQPPEYRAWRDAERALPQNNADLPAPQGRDGRYIRFSNHLRMAGWGHAMQEMIANAHLALESRRIFVLYNYDREDDLVDYNLFSWGLAHTRVPISALLGGPIAGGAFPTNQSHSPAVTPGFFREVCPQPTLIDVSALKAELGIEAATAAVIMERVAEYLANLEDNCVELKAESGQVFDSWLFKDPALMEDLRPTLLQSPILSAWEWSALVVSGVDANRKAIHPHVTPGLAPGAQIGGLLALHIPRGNFEDHCERDASERRPYKAFNAHPSFPDQPALPPPAIGIGTGVDDDADAPVQEYYQAHCYPSLMDIVRRVAQVRREAAVQGRRLDRVYVLSNAPRGWLAGLKYALHRAGPWESITSSRDLELSWEQQFVLPGMDMMLAEHAEVFLGNAWSTVSANINMLRVAHNTTPETTRFW